MTALRNAFLEHVRNDYPEDDEWLNNSSRQAIRAMREASGDCWLGNINLYPESDQVIWRWDGDFVCNFEASFAVPRYDQNLERLILERDQADYTGTVDDGKRVDTIIQRIIELHGVLLHWS